MSDKKKQGKREGWFIFISLLVDDPYPGSVPSFEKTPLQRGFQRDRRTGWTMQFSPK
jgi:hypothetical protein